MQNQGDGLNANTRTLIYSLQFARGLSPVYVPLTKGGFAVTAFTSFMFYQGNGSFFLIIFTVGLYWVIYKYFFDLKYHEVERVWLISKWIDFITVKRERPFTSKPFLSRFGED